MKSIEGGLTQARLYSFEREGKKYVFRFLSLGPSQTEERRLGEIRALTVGSSLDLVPPCTFVDKNVLVMVMPYIEGHSLHKPTQLQLIKLGKMLHSLHTFSGEYPTRYTLEQRLERHYHRGLEEGVAYPTGFDQEVEKVLSRPSSCCPVLCHGDLNPSNILISGDRLSIIDWTNATWDDLFTDLSYICALTHLSLTEEKLFLKAYFGREPLEQEWKILKEKKATVYLLTATIWFRFSETIEERTLPLISRRKALDTELRAPTLKSAEVYLKEGTVVDFKTASPLEIRSYALSFYKAYLKSRLLPNIFIFGPSCSGKSSLAQRLKERLGEKWIYLDRDYLIENGEVEEKDADCELERQLKSQMIVDAQIPWREKQEGEMYFLLFPPLEELLKRDQLRTERCGRDEKRAYYARQYVIDTFEILQKFPTEFFDATLDTSTESLESEVDKVLAIIGSKSK